MTYQQTRWPMPWLKLLSPVGWPPVKTTTTYLLQDEFITNQSAPLTSPRTCEPGPGTATIVDTTNKMSIASTQLTIVSVGVTNFTDPRIDFAGQTRAAGLAFVFAMKITTTGVLSGWAGTHTGGSGEIKHAIFAITIGQAFNSWDGANQMALTGFGTIASNTWYKVAVVLISTGAYLFVKGGAFGPWTLLWRFLQVNTATMFPTLRGNTAENAVYERVGVTQLGSPFTTDEGIASQNVASPTTATNYAATADQIVDMTLTAAATILTVGGVRFRVQDSSNYWIMYFDTAGAFKVDSVVAGTPTNRVNVAGVIAGSGTRTMRAIMMGSSLDFYTLNSTTWTKRGSAITNSTLSTQTTDRTDFGADWTVTNLKSWPCISSNYNALDLI